MSEIPEGSFPARKKRLNQGLLVLADLKESGNMNCIFVHQKLYTLRLIQIDFIHRAFRRFVLYTFGGDIPSYFFEMTFFSYKIKVFKNPKD